MLSAIMISLTSWRGLRASSKILEAHSVTETSLIWTDYAKTSKRKSISGADKPSPFLIHAMWRSGLLRVLRTRQSAVRSSLSKAHDVEYYLINIHSLTLRMMLVSLSRDPGSGTWIPNSDWNSLKPRTSFFLCFAHAVWKASLVSSSWI